MGSFASNSVGWCRNFAKKLQSKTEIREKLHKTLSYKKAGHKLLMNWHLGSIHQHFMSSYFNIGSKLLFLTYGIERT